MKEKEYEIVINVASLKSRTMKNQWDKTMVRKKEFNMIFLYEFLTFEYL